MNYLEKLTQVLNSYKFNSEELQELMQNEPILLMHALNKLKAKEAAGYVSSSFRYLINVCNQERLTPSAELEALKAKYPTPPTPSPATYERHAYERAVFSAEERRALRRRQLERRIIAAGGDTEKAKQFIEEYEKMEESISNSNVEQR